MATPPVTPPEPTQPSEVTPVLQAPVILGTMLRTGKNVSDLIFSPGRLPQVEQNGQLVPVFSFSQGRRWRRDDDG